MTAPAAAAPVRVRVSLGAGLGRPAAAAAGAVRVSVRPNLSLASPLLRHELSPLLTRAQRSAAPAPAAGAAAALPAAQAKPRERLAAALTAVARTMKPAARSAPLLARAYDGTGETPAYRGAEPVAADPPARAAGILLHPTSLASRFGIGDLGPEAYRFVDFLQESGQSYWQLLPLTLTEPGTGDSPYQSVSAFARNTLLLSPELLARDGWIDPDLLRSAPPDTPGAADYAGAATFKRRLLDAAWERQRATPRKTEAFAEFKRANAYWLDDYALFAAIRAEQGAERSWNAWPEPLRRRDGAALRAFAERQADALERLRFEQFLFDRQWSALRAYARARGVRLIGDAPIYVGYESADVWAHPEYFQLDARGAMRFVSGVPPDFFSATGQLWGTPVYEWPALRADGYRWWRERLKASLALVDKVRIDHFRGLVQYWRVPAGARTAMPEEGAVWADGPGDSFFDALAGEFPGALIAEDLGVITPDVTEVMERYRLPGMRVVQFAFGDENGVAANPHLPENHPARSVAYTGTHDNDTLRGWLDAAGERERRNLAAYFARLGLPLPRDPAELAWELARRALGSAAELAILPMQDALELGGQARMNVPGTPSGNWRWRLRPGSLARALAERLRALTTTAGRAPSAPAPY